MDDTRGEGRQHMERSALYFPATCPAIYRVPNEILRKIFSHITNFGPCGLEDLINASHVCHLWRVLALQTKELWTDITLSFAGGSVARQAQEAGLALERSKPLPITVHISNPPSAPELGNYRELVLRALRELPRVRVLCISSFETTEPDEFFDSITQILQTHPAPLLEELRFDHIPDDISSGNLFAGQVPPKLHLIYTDMDDILNILRGLPSLEHLGLTPEPAMAEIESLSFPAVHLPNLRNVAITGYCGLITRFMRYLDFAVDVDIHFQLLCERVIDFSYLSELSWICDGRFSKIFAAGLYY
ncbi:hypothetical protein BV25DRAFT_1993993 [Artomyces pyxidatus]|uniref:Uncharacterized protein n=1 Tax=Artomyces pyxidatus TaxID=48021 RepID=A0ACB8SRR9_9AGAM|nr:hypothetical protein BV25DRAFT_1993993 [Artomyces pyxidatus]